MTISFCFRRGQIWLRAGLAALLFWGAGELRAEISLSALFSDHAVLQKADKVCIWGDADPGENVHIHIGGATADTSAGEDGHWRAYLDLREIGAGPFNLTVEGKNHLTIRDVVIGEVWFASGQSNMEFTLDSALGAREEIESSSNPLLREFKVNKSAVDSPTAEYSGKWVLADPSTVGKFTAVGYYFGKTLQNQTGLPVGIINASWGGTPIESWLSAEGLDRDPSLKSARYQIMEEVRTYPERLEGHTLRYREWLEQFQLQDRESASDFVSSLPQSAWKPATIPGTFVASGLADAGAVWVRREVTIPDAGAGVNITLKISVPNGGGSLAPYWNGRLLEEASPEAGGINPVQKFVIPGSLVKAGSGILNIRIFAPAGGGGIPAPEPVFAFWSPDLAPITLKGEWSGCDEFSLTPSAEARAAQVSRLATLRDPQYRPSHLFNGMIAPLTNYAIAGVIWYQGESNVSRAWQYRTSFPALIQDWRHHWNQGDFPFYYCQIANFYPHLPQPAESRLAELREAQEQALSLPNTGRAVLIDLGETADIHPRNKKDVGERLARIALANCYGKNTVYSSPTYESMKAEGEAIRVRFRDVGGGLEAKLLPTSEMLDSTSKTEVPLVRNSSSEVEGFAVCGKDGKWHWASARIEGDSVLVKSPDVPQPIAVRYAWASNPICNLYNKDGLPVAPFRTDDFPLTSREEKYK